MADSSIRSFHDLRIWSLGIEIVKETYQLTKKFPNEEKFGLTNQMRRAAVSIPSNIAEGHIRAHTKEFLQFLRIALGSCAELHTQAIIAKELNFFVVDELKNYLKKLDDEGKQIRGLIQKLSED